MKDNVFEKFSDMDNLKSDIKVKANPIIKKANDSNSDDEVKFRVIDLKLVVNKKDKGEKK